MIPRLYDEYEEYAQIYFEAEQKGTIGENDKAKVFKFSQIGEIKHPPKVKFSILAQWIQMPNMAEEIKKHGLEEWVPYARVWLNRYAPEDKRFEVQKELPEITSSLSENQKKLLSEASKLLDKDWKAEDFQTKIYQLGKELGLSSQKTFEAFYKALIGKTHGPKAAWLILSLDKDFVKRRLTEV